MKKFLLSIFAVMLAVFSVQAEEKNGTITFKTSGSDTAANPIINGNITNAEIRKNLRYTIDKRVSSS